MRIRLEGAYDDLHAADATYDKSCYKTFTSVRNITAAQMKSTASENEQDKAIEEVTSAIRKHHGEASEAVSQKSWDKF